MKKSWLNIVLLTSVTAFGLAACDNQGGAEQAGEKMDETIEQVQDQSQQMADEAKETMGMEEQGAMEEMGEKMDEAAENIKNAASEQAAEMDQAMDDATAEMEQTMDDAAAEADRKLNEMMEDTKE